MKLPLILDYEIYDEDGPCAPYFTGRITDADGRVMCNAESEERAVELVDHVAALLARHNALEEAVRQVLEEWLHVRPQNRDNWGYELVLSTAQLDALAALVGEG